MNTSAPMQMDIERHAALPFPRSLPEFQRLFPNDAACAEYLENLRWADGFVCPYCGATGEPFRIATRPGVLTCRKCRRQTQLPHFGFSRTQKGAELLGFARAKRICGAKVRQAFLG